MMNTEYEIDAFGVRAHPGEVDAQFRGNSKMGQMQTLRGAQMADTPTLKGQLADINKMLSVCLNLAQDARQALFGSEPENDCIRDELSPDSTLQNAVDEMQATARSLHGVLNKLQRIG
jgi:hypothetical protein